MPTLESLPPPPDGLVGWPWTSASAPWTPTPEAPLPRISIVTPSFNQAEFIEETIRSVLLQGYPNLQYIIIDGGSIDGTKAILEKYGTWLDFWVSETDDGQSDAINKGLNRCDGEWFNWLNSDDYLFPGALQVLGTAARTTSNPIISGVTRNVGSPQGRSEYAARVGPFWPDLLFNLGVNQPGSLLRASSVRSVGAVRKDLSLCMDLDLWLRLALGHGPGAILEIPQVLAAYRYHPASKTCRQKDAFAYEEFCLITALAASLGSLPAELSDTLGFLAATKRYAFSSPHKIEAKRAELAYLDRILVSDSLLFRAIASQPALASDPATPFLQALLRLRPALGRHFDAAEVARIETRALVNALESLGRPDLRMSARVMMASPTVGNFVNLARIAYQNYSRF